MKSELRDGNWRFTTKYVQDKVSNGNFVRYIEGLEYVFLNIDLKQMNMTFVHVPTPEGFEIQEGLVNDTTPDGQLSHTHHH
jgi:hypothetical protein